MAATYRPSDALDIAKRYLKGMPIEQVGTRILDSVAKYIWMAAPWRWTIGTFPTVTLASNTQDYTVALPADFLFLVKSEQTDSAGAIGREFEIMPVLPVGGQLGNINSVAVSGTAGNNGTLRVFPKPPTLPAGTHSIISLYKKTSPIITPKNQTDVGSLLMDDEWFWVFESGVKWLAYQYGDDQRAGAASTADGKITYTGQRGIFEADIQTMIQREKLPRSK